MTKEQRKVGPKRDIIDAKTKVTTYIDPDDRFVRTALVVSRGDSHGGSIDVLRSDGTRAFQINLFIDESPDGIDIVDVIVGHGFKEQRNLTVFGFQHGERQMLKLEPGNAVVSVDLRPATNGKEATQ
jgi:hypothetical protein